MKRKRDKKGITSLEVVICIMIVIVSLSGFADMSALIQKTSAVNQSAGYVTRVVSRQGGTGETKFRNYSDEFVKTSTLYDNVKKSMESVGVPESDWTLKINEQVIAPGTQYGPFDYGTTMDVKIESSFKWTLTSNFVPGEIKTNSESKSRGMSTYKIRNSGYR